LSTDVAKHPGVVPLPLVRHRYWASRPAQAVTEVWLQGAVGRTAVIIEAMKTMTQILTARRHRAQILFETARPVECGGTLVIN